MYRSKMGRSQKNRKNIAVCSAVEGLEARRLFAAFLTQGFTDVVGQAGQAPVTLSLENRFENDEVNGTVVRLGTVLGNVDLELFDQAVTGRSAAPITTANFLNYVNSGRYNSTFFHRSVNDFVVQGGGFTASDNGGQLSVGNVQTDAQIQNEFSTDRPNVRGTVAMAKLGSGPDTATSQFFFNLGDNRANLDNQNGGFTTFARVLDNPNINDGLEVVDALAALQVIDASGGNPNSAFGELPVRNFTSGGAVGFENLALINTANVIREFNFTVNSSNPNAATATVVTDQQGNRQLQLTFPQNASGSTVITVTATDVIGQTVQTSFNVTLQANFLVNSVVVNSGNLSPGTSESFTVQVSNTEINASPTSIVRLVLSDGQTNTTLTDIELPSIPAGQTATLNTTVTIPAGLAAGNYTLTATVDPAGAIAETNENDNVASVQTVVESTAVIQVEVGSTIVGNGQTDPVVFDSVVQGTTPSPRITLFIRNIGNQPLTINSFNLPVPFTVFDASSNIRLGDAGQTPPVQLNLPAVLQPPTGQVGANDFARITLQGDSSIIGTVLANLVIGSDAANGTTFTVPLSQTVIPPQNLQMTSVSVPGGFAVGDSTVSVQAVVANTSTSSPLQSVVRVVLTGTGISPVTLGDIALPAFDAGTSQTVSGTFNLPQGLTSGQFTLTATVDPDAALSETSETDNTATGTFNVGRTRAVSVTISDVPVLSGQAEPVNFARIIQGGAPSRLTVLIQNSGDLPLTITSINVPQPFIIFDASSNIRVGPVGTPPPIQLNVPITLQPITPGVVGTSTFVRLTIESDETLFGIVTDSIVISSDAQAGQFLVPIRQTVVLPIVLGDDGNAQTPNFSQVSLIDADGTPVRVSYRGAGSATVGIIGTNLEVTGSRSLVAGGSDVRLVLVNVNNSNGASTLQITPSGGGNGSVEIESIATGALRSLTGRNVVVTDSFTSTGPIGTLTLTTLDSASLSLGQGQTVDPNVRVSLRIDNVNESSIVSNYGIRSLSVRNYSDTATPASLSAPVVDSLSILGGSGFGSNLTISSGVRRLSIRPAITGGTWNVSAPAGAISVGSVASGASLNFPNGVSSLSVTGDFNGSTDASFYRSLSIRGGLNNANLRVRGNVDKFSVTGSVSNSRVRIDSVLTSFSAAAFSNSSLYVGLDNAPTSGLPATPNYAGSSSIGTITLKNRAETFVNSSISSRQIGSASLGVISGDEGSAVDFGILADVISRLTFTPAAGARPFSATALDSNDRRDQLFSSAQITTVGYEIRLT